MTTPGTATDEDSGEEYYSNSSSNLYQPLPATPDDTGEQYQLHLPRTRQTQNSSNHGARVNHTGSRPPSAEYSVIMRRNLDLQLTPSQSLEDILEVSDEDEEEEEGWRNRMTAAGYSIIRHEDMDDYVSEGTSEEEEGWINRMTAAGYSTIRQEDMEGTSEEEEGGRNRITAGYSMIRQEDMDDHVSEGVSEEEEEEELEDSQDSRESDDERGEEGRERKSEEIIRTPGWREQDNSMGPGGGGREGNGMLGDKDSVGEEDISDGSRPRMPTPPT